MVATATKKRHLALRIAGADLELIDQLAAKHGLTRTDYMVRASTGDLRDPIDLEARFDELDERISRLEGFAFA
jgi:uncharacterized protein (DUF1778 family)